MLQLDRDQTRQGRALSLSAALDVLKDSPRDPYGEIGLSHAVKSFTMLHD